MAIPGDFHVEICDWANAAERAALTALRETVFIVEQRVPRDMEIDADDPRSVHVLARALDGTPIGTGRLVCGDAIRQAAVTTTPASESPGEWAFTPVPATTPAEPGRIGRMAVLREWRGRGVGSTLLDTLLNLARARHLANVTLHAQRDALPFYARHGFVAQGGEFEEAGIPHVLMRRELAALAVPERAGPLANPHPLLLRAASREELIAVTQQLLAGARHGVCVRIRELHPLLLDDSACLVELRRIAISGRAASIRILAEDLTRALRDGMRLLELARRLASVIELRRPVEQTDLEYPSAFMCVDTQGFLFRPLECAMNTVGSTWAPGRHAQLMRLFEDVWARSEAWPELRTLGI